MSSIPAESPTRVAIALVRRGNRFLVGTRPEGLPLAGCREFPGGKCEPGEAADETARRECMEETGLDVVTGSLRRVVRHAYPHALVELYYWDCEPADSGANHDNTWALCHADLLAAIGHGHALRAASAALTGLDTRTRSVHKRCAGVRSMRRNRRE